MKIIRALVLGFLCSAFIQTGCWAQEPYIWDFGAVKEGEVLRHNFILKNASKGVLKIKDMNTSCGCTASKVAKKTLSPGEKTAIRVQFKTYGYSGAVEQYIYVHTDNLMEPLVKFSIKANVVKNK